MTPLIEALTVVAALGSGLIAGVFYAFSTFVMGALARLVPPEGIRAMQSINVVVLNPWFLGVFLGMTAPCVVLALAALIDWSMPRSAYLLGGAVLYVVGCVGVTMALNVPLNNALAAAKPDSADGAAVWKRYVSDWTMWNHVRTAASFAASALFIVVLWQ